MRRVTTLSSLFAIGIPACQGDHGASDDLVVETEVNAALDFAVYQRFAVLDPVEILYEEPPGQYEQGRLELLAAIEEDMTALGLIPDDDAPQLVVSTYVAIEPNEDFIAGYFGLLLGYDFFAGANDWVGPDDWDLSGFAGTVRLEIGQYDTSPGPGRKKRRGKRR